MVPYQDRSHDMTMERHVVTFFLRMPRGFAKFGWASNETRFNCGTFLSPVVASILVLKGICTR